MAIIINIHIPPFLGGCTTFVTLYFVVVIFLFISISLCLSLYFFSEFAFGSAIVTRSCKLTLNYEYNKIRATIALCAPLDNSVVAR